MKNNHQLNDSETDHHFYNVESVESVYPADAMDIIDCVSAQLTDNNKLIAEPVLSAANDQYSQGRIYSLDNARIVKKTKSQERRALKSRLTDRRSDVRITASGEPQQDRRAANQIANIEAIRLTHTPT